MTDNEAIEYIKNACELSKKVIHDLEKIKEKAERSEKIGEYYANLENCYKEIEASNIAIKALEEIQQYRAIGTVEEIEPYVRLGEKLNLCDLVSENARLVKKIQFLEIYEKQLKEYKEIGTVEDCRESINNLDAKENYIKQILWERNIAIQQLEEIEVSLGERMNFVKDAIEKQKAKRPDMKADKYTNLIYYYCPVCGRYFGQAGTHSIISFDKPQYCTCGQAISWEKEEKYEYFKENSKTD